MPSEAYAVVLGHTGSDPDVRTTQDGMKIARFSVAVTDKTKTDELTTWYNITAFDKLAASWPVVNAKKGDLIMVRGRPSLRTYTKKDGTQGHSLEIRADRITLLTPKKVEEHSAIDPVSVYAAPSRDALEDDIPF